ncbi:aryl-sulfate sulfotransferase [Brachyspira pulli]|uniref:aryl-sulfate sulfotransferase n=1 Tax=Brachyspira pulli TaxID=310721 RepID=UPI0030041C52
MNKYILLVIFIIQLLSCNHTKTTTSINKLGSIILNPYGYTPLSAIYKISSINSSPITVTVKGQHGENDLIHTYEAGYGTEFEIHGLYPECNNTIIVNDAGRIIIKNQYVDSITFNGIKIPSKFKIEYNNLEKENYSNNPDLYFVGLKSDVTLGISKNGFLRYFNNKSYFSKIDINKKNIMLFSFKINDIGCIYSLSGKKILEFPTSHHHDIIKHNDHYIYLSDSQYGSEDRLIEIDQSGNIIKDLNFGNLIENIVYKKNDKDEIEKYKKVVFGEAVNNIYKYNSVNKNVDWFHANSLVYDNNTDILYVSSRHRGVLAINYSKWELIWWMADDSINTTVDINAISTTIPYDMHFKDLKSLEPYRVNGDALKDGPKNQHALFLLKNGHIGMFDNQGDENINLNGSRYVEYKVTGTHGNYRAEKIYEYRKTSLYSRITSDIDYTGINYQNILIAYGTAKKIIELEKNTKKELFNLDIDLSFSDFLYRVDKMPFYYDENRIYSEDDNMKNKN